MKKNHLFKRLIPVFVLFMAGGITSGRAYQIENLKNAEMAEGPSQLIFSEYIEGSSNNKALEIFNPGEDIVSLDNYQIAQSVNGGGWEYYHIFPPGNSLQPGDVWVIVNEQVDPALYDTTQADEVLGYPSVVTHNGDDARGLIYISDTDTVLIDVIGDPDVDPGSGWDVAGVNSATANHTLVRKSYILQGNTNWTESAGSDSISSEWLVYDTNFMDSLGTHTYKPFIEVTSINLTAEGGVAAIDTDKDTLMLMAEVLPADATDSRLEWSVNDPVLASVSQNGRLIAINDGIVTVTAAALDGSGVKGTIDITLSNQTPVIPVSTITVTGEAGATTIDVAGGTLQLSAEVLPVDASDDSIIWSVNNEAMASIDQTGLLTAISNGTVIVSATAWDGFGGEGVLEITISNQIIDVADLAALKAKDPADQNAVYRITGEVVLTYQQSFRNKKYVQDAGGGVLIDDSPGAITTTYSVGDGITGLTGTLEDYSGLLEFHPVSDPGAATSNGNPIVPVVVTPAELKSDLDTYESRVVPLESIEFTDADGSLSFGNGKNYDITDGPDTIVCRTEFYDTSLKGTTIPDSADLTGIVIEYQGAVEVAPRSLEDVVNLAPYEKSSDASIIDLLVNGVSVAGFTPAQINYNVELDAGTTEIPVVTVVTNHDSAVVSVTDATNLSGTEAERTTTVLITAEDGVTTKTYVVVFSLSVGIGDLVNQHLDIYPVPAQNHLFLRSVGSVEEVRVIDFTGSVLKTWKFSGENSIDLDISDLHSGVFLLKLTTGESSRVIRFVKE